MRYMIFCLVCLAASCGAGASQPVREQRAVVTDYHFQGFASDHGGAVAFQQPDGPGSPLAHLSPDGWVKYNWDASWNFRDGALQVMPDASAALNGEYWVGLQDVANQRWQWFGPFVSSESPSFGDQDIAGSDIGWDLVVNGGTVVIYCTKSFSMSGILYVCIQPPQ